MNFTLQIQNQQSSVLNCCHLWREEDFVPSNTYAKWNQILCNASFAQDIQHKEYPSLKFPQYLQRIKIMMGMPYREVKIMTKSETKQEPIYILITFLLKMKSRQEKSMLGIVENGKWALVCRSMSCSCKNSNMQAISRQN